MRLRDMLKDRGLLKEAKNAEDEVSLCERVSRRYGLELTLKQAEKLMDKAQGRKRAGQGPGATRPDQVEFRRNR